MFYDKFHVVEYAKCSKCLQTETRKGYSLLFLAISQLLHGWFMFTQSLFVIGQVIIFFFQPKVKCFTYCLGNIILHRCYKTQNFRIHLNIYDSHLAKHLSEVARQPFNLYEKGIIILSNNSYSELD